MITPDFCHGGRPAPATARLYWQDDHCVDANAIVLAVRDDALACDRSCFYPGGGGQPADTGRISLPGGETLDIVSVHADADGVVWHTSSSAPPCDIVGQKVRLAIDRDRRLALTRYHTALHIVNTIALRDYAGWITGAQIGVDYARIDFKLEDFSRTLCAELECKVNAVLARSYTLRAYYLPEEAFRQRGDLLRTLEVSPPVHEGKVRIVEIQGFDAQACGGTHVSNTSELGRLSIFRTENKGKINKRLYVRLEQADVRER